MPLFFAPGNLRNTQCEGRDQNLDVSGTGGKKGAEIWGRNPPQSEMEPSPSPHPCGPLLRAQTRLDGGLHCGQVPFVWASKGGGLVGVPTSPPPLRPPVALRPAFGASVHVMKDLLDRNVQIVDTTCPWVSKVQTPPLDPGGGSVQIKADYFILTVEGD